ncbi:hypothetical protein CEXT_665641 [Caerostris extrusa]|uniref:Uncharacterized protein n=1 Tax=Caerostris extrusa TaxID=172846 RepID=A0AAV4XZ26_CAEEX|nr:hypothetical protein CEXT_665641 [Caerostris extrusa]
MNVSNFISICLRESILLLSPKPKSQKQPVPSHVLRSSSSVKSIFKSETVSSFNPGSSVNLHQLSQLRNSQFLPVYSVNLSQSRSQKQSAPFSCPQSIFLQPFFPCPQPKVKNSQFLPVSSDHFPRSRSQKQSVPSRVLNQSSPVRKSKIVSSFRCLQSIFFF